MKEMFGSSISRQCCYVAAVKLVVTSLPGRMVCQRVEPALQEREFLIRHLESPIFEQSW